MKTITRLFALSAVFAAFAVSAVASDLATSKDKEPVKTWGPIYCTYCHYGCSGC